MCICELVCMCVCLSVCVRVCVCVCVCVEGEEKKNIFTKIVKCSILDISWLMRYCASMQIVTRS